MSKAFDKVNYFRENEVQNSTPRIGHSSQSSTEDFVMRFEFTAPDIGASSFSFELNNAYWYPRDSGGINLNPSDHNNSAYFLFVISESDSEYLGYNHKNAESPKVIDGVVLARDDGKGNSGYYTLCCEPIQKLLLPGRTYYLWVFPNFQKHYYYWLFSGGYTPEYNYTLGGSAGVIRIKEGDKELITIPLVKENGKFIELAATIKSGDQLLYCV